MGGGGGVAIVTKAPGTVGRNLKMWVGMAGIHGKIVFELLLYFIT